MVAAIASFERPSRTLLLAETDRYALDRLTRILCERIPDISIDICPSAELLCQTLKNASYDTVVMSPALMRDYFTLQQRSVQHLLAPMIVTAFEEECPMAETSLKAEAFDLIVKPIVPFQAVQTVNVALWQNKFLRLLASKERAAVRFQEHMKAFPHAVKMQQEFVTKMAAYERTIRALSASMRQLLNIEEEQSAFDIAALVARLTKQRALNRLFNLCKQGPTH